jgi:hypothetical protein
MATDLDRLLARDEWLLLLIHGATPEEAAAMAEAAEFSFNGPGVVVPCRKCSNCGWSASE